MNKITVIGNAIVDVIAAPIDKNIFEQESSSADTIKSSFGGDALNESVILSRFGKNVELITKLGKDDSGERVLDFLSKNHIDSSKVVIDADVETSINIVLVDRMGERYFITNPKSSQRSLGKRDILCCIASSGQIVSLASMFISPLLDVAAMEDIFFSVKQYPGKILSVDMVRNKDGIQLRDLERVLPYIDFIMPNSEEIASLTGSSDLYKNACALVDAGCKYAVVKCGKEGCLIKSRDMECYIPAYPTERCVDTTGAGDCFAAGFLWALSENWSVPDCGCFASATASCAIEEIGATEGVRSLDEVLARFQVVKTIMKERN